MLHTFLRTRISQLQLTAIAFWFYVVSFPLFSSLPQYVDEYLPKLSKRLPKTLLATWVVSWPDCVWDRPKDSPGHSYSWLSFILIRFLCVPDDNSS